MIGLPAGLGSKKRWPGFTIWVLGGAVGENLHYMSCATLRAVPGLPAFRSGGLKRQARDQFNGWTSGQRQSHLGLVANNTRFLYPALGHVPDFGSWDPGQVAGRIARDWQAKYGHPVVPWRPLWNGAQDGVSGR